jgi:hypothetical protein
MDQYNEWKRQNGAIAGLSVLNPLVGFATGNADLGFKGGAVNAQLAGAILGAMGGGGAAGAMGSMASGLGGGSGVPALPRQNFQNFQMGLE